MKARKKKLVSSLLSLLLIVSMVFGNLGNVQFARAEDGVSTDTISINFFDYTRDTKANTGSLSDTSKLYFSKSLGSSSGEQNVWHETDVYADIVKGTLDANKRPQFNFAPTSKNADLFNPASSSYKGTGVLNLDKAKNGVYTYSSRTNGMTFAGNGNDVIINDSTAGFWPFDNGSRNEYFGISFEKDFYIPQGSTSTDYTFSFSGDDDVWVFIDDYLVLDIGGIHGAIKADINFTQGTVSYTYLGYHGDYTASVNTSAGILGVAEGEKSEAQKNLENSAVNGIFDKGKSHKLRFFYLERGAEQSNCSFSYNLPMTTYTVKHVFETADGTGYESLDEVRDVVISAPMNTPISASDIIVKTSTDNSLIGTLYGAGTVLPTDNTNALTINNVLRPSATVAAPYTSATTVLNGSVVYVLYPRLTKTVSYAFEGTAPEGVTPPASAAYRIGSTVDVEEDASATDWTFTGWHTSSASAVTVADSDTGFTMPAADVTLYGSWVQDTTSTPPAAEQIELNVEKKWKKAEGHRLNVTINLMLGDQKLDSIILTFNNAAPSDDNRWLGTFGKYNKYDSENNLIKYYVTENAVGKNYKTDYGKTVSDTSILFTVTNTYESPYTPPYTDDPDPDPLPLYYNITYRLDGDCPDDATVPKPSKAEAGKKVRLAAASESSYRNVKFLGWNASQITVSNGEFTMPENDVVFIGMWQQEKEPEDTPYGVLTVKYYLNGVFEEEKVTSVRGMSQYEVIPESTYIKDTITYNYDSADGAPLKGEMDIANKTINLYYVYTAPEPEPSPYVPPISVIYRVSYVLTDATGDNLNLFEPGDAYYYAGDFVTVSAVPAIDHSLYEFSGWSTSDLLLDLDSILGFAMPTNNITIYGTVTKLVPTSTPIPTAEPTPTEVPATPTPTTEPVPTEPVPTEPEEIIEPEPIPQDEPEIEEIIEDDLPTDLPETGTTSNTIFYLFAAGLVITGLAIGRKRNRKISA